MIEVKNLTKKYGKITAIKNLNFTVEKGEVLGFLGPNGAGKSTTMKILTGFMPSTEGTVYIEGLDIWENDKEAKKIIGYMPENPPLYGDMTVLSFLEFAAELKGIPKKSIKPRINETMEMLSIEDVAHRVIKNLSKGYKQRVGLAQAILGNPKVLILDEPTIGLDPNQIIEIRDVIKKLSQDRTIILSSHILSEVSQLCNRVIIINKGEIVAVDLTEDLPKRFKQNNVIEARIIGEPQHVIEILKTMKYIKNVEIIGQRESGSVDYRITTDVDSDIRPDLLKALSGEEYKIIELKSINLSLEDVFMQITTTDYKQEKEEKNE